MARCIECERLATTQRERMLVLGFVACGVERTRGRYFSAEWERDCERFRPASPNAVEERRQNLKKIAGGDDEKTLQDPARNPAAPSR